MKKSKPKARKARKARKKATSSSKRAAAKVGSVTKAKSEPITTKKWLRKFPKELRLQTIIAGNRPKTVEACREARLRRLVKFHELIRQCHERQCLERAVGVGKLLEDKRIITRPFPGAREVILVE